MIDFIIIEDNFYFIKKYNSVIDKIMINYDINYNITTYDRYTNIQKSKLSIPSFKIYIIDYNKNIKQLLKYIREVLDDWNSLIILLYDNNIEKISRNYFILDYIDKTTNIKAKLTRSLQICLKNYDQRPNKLKYSYKGIFYNIEYRNILYIEKEQDNKRCIIKTTNKDYYISGNLCDIENYLDNRFIKTSRSYIVNIERIESYDIKTNTINFENCTLVSAISRDKKKDFINMMRKV